jgi:hypothetical protein
MLSVAIALATIRCAFNSWQVPVALSHYAFFLNRYRLLDYEAAKEVQKRGEKQNRPIHGAIFSSNSCGCRAANCFLCREGENLSSKARANRGWMARLIAQWRSERVGQSFIVENRQALPAQ